jgi:putative ABC transport system substrate-binding protein
MCALMESLRRVVVGMVLVLTAFGLAEECWAQNKTAKVGVLIIADVREVQDWLKPFKRRLQEHGWIEGKNVQFEYRNAGGDPTRYAEPVAELLKLKVDVLFAIGLPAVRAAFAATRDIPIVAHDLVGEPVAAGYARSYARPGGNLTGVFLATSQLAGKWLEVLKAMIPNLFSAVVIWDPTSGPVPIQAVQDVAPSFGVKLQVLQIRNPDEIDKAPSLFRGRPQALIILASPMLYAQSERLARLAKKQRLPATAMWASFAKSGGLLAYGPEMVSTAERCAELVEKILNGANPGDLPIEQPTKFELVVNLRAAKALGITIPEWVLLRADEVIR